MSHCPFIACSGEERKEEFLLSPKRRLFFYPFDVYQVGPAWTGEGRCSQGHGASVLSC